MSERPWESEPTAVEFEHHGFQCRIKRIPMMGHLCGYVLLPRDHPWWGLGDEDIPVHIHGGLTAASEVDGLWQIGFDCAHCGDYVPHLGFGRLSDVYRDLAFVTAQTQILAEQARMVLTLGPDGKPLD